LRHRFLLKVKLHLLKLSLSSQTDDKPRVCACRCRHLMCHYQRIVCSGVGGVQVQVISSYHGIVVCRYSYTAEVGIQFLQRHKKRRRRQLVGLVAQQKTHTFNVRKTGSLLSLNVHLRYPTEHKNFSRAISRNSGVPSMVLLIRLVEFHSA